jgi:uncharacterized membrane protein (UPF0127 family)
MMNILLNPNGRHRRFRQLCTVAFLGFAAAFSPSLPGGQTVALTVKGHAISVAVAATADLREKGLMGRDKLNENEGMLFVFPQAGRHAMWMKNTPLPLSVAFIDWRGRIVNIAEMTPYSLEEHAAKTDALYALEMRGGWFHHHGVAPGDRVHGLKDAGKGI